MTAADWCCPHCGSTTLVEVFTLAGRATQLSFAGEIFDTSLLRRVTRQMRPWYELEDRVRSDLGSRGWPGEEVDALVSSAVRDAASTPYTAYQLLEWRWVAAKKEDPIVDATNPNG